MSAKGQEECVSDYLTNKAIRDAEGNVVRIDGRYGIPDAVDYKNYIIYDLKPWEKLGLDKIEQLYAEQFDFYKRLYQQAYGVVPRIEIITYIPPSP